MYGAIDACFKFEGLTFKSQFQTLRFTFLKQKQEQFTVNSQNSINSRSEAHKDVETYQCKL